MENDMTMTTEEFETIMYLNSKRLNLLRQLNQMLFDGKILTKEGLKLFDYIKSDDPEILDLLQSILDGIRK